MPLIFVHGITVREERFSRLLGSVRSGFLKQRPSLVVEGFYWGNMASSLRYGGASIPGFLGGTRAIDQAMAAVTDARQLSMLLLDDPLLEFNLLKDIEDFDPTGAGFTPIPHEVEQRNQTLEQRRVPIAVALANNQVLHRLAGKQVLQNRWQDLVKATFNAAGRTDRSLGVSDLIDPLTRSLTASLYREVEGGQTTLDTEFQWTSVEQEIQRVVESELGGQRSWIGDKVKGLAGGAAAHGVTFAMRHGLRRRIMDTTSIFVGDILAYMAKRDEIQTELEKAIAAAIQKSNTPIWLVGHSLGGILCFDYCLRTARKVERLMTVGSQVGLFGELGAFPQLQQGPAGIFEAPACVARWINMYDPDDILSFLAAPVITKASDIEYDTKAPFPVSHSEYWNHDSVYESLVQ